MHRQKNPSLLASAVLVTLVVARPVFAQEASSTPTIAEAAPAAHPSGTDPGAPCSIPASAPAATCPKPFHPGLLRADNWLVSFQTTWVWQQKPPFHAAFSGPESLSTAQESGFSLSTTTYLGFRPWSGAEIFINPETIQTVPISNLQGLAGLSNGENQKGGGPLPTIYIARLFLRQTLPLGTASTPVEVDENQFAMLVPKRRIVLTVGRFALVDMFDTTPWARDPRTQFLNWDLLTYSADDYAADSRGYTWGAAVEWYQDAWAVRFAHLAQPLDANGLQVDPRIWLHFGDYLEVEHAHALVGLPGHVRALAFLNRARMGGFEDAIAYARVHGGTPDVASVRQDQDRWGFGFGADQNFSEDGGVFVRGSWSNGRTEEYAFMDTERSLAVGAASGGRAWGRPRDTVGLACAIDGLSQEHREYLADGGLGFFVGDGKLPHYAPEQLVEAYYSFAAFTGFWASLDYQLICNPAYDADRGPVQFYGVRLHYEY